MRTRTRAILELNARIAQHRKTLRTSKEPGLPCEDVERLVQTLEDRLRTFTKVS